MQFEYLKMRGAGNRILVIDARGGDHSPPSADQLRRLGDPATGPGFDQLMWVSSATDGARDAGYRVFNADGSEVEQCGNGVRCVAWMLARRNGKREFRLESPAGIIDARILGGDQVSVAMGAPRFDPREVPFIAENAAKIYEIDVNGQKFDASVLSMGNPHCVIRVSDVAGADVARWGPAIEHHPRFPSRCNVGFMAVRNRHELDLRVHERGVGETAACGTGACAAMVAARRLGLVDSEAAVNLPGGQLVVSWRRPAGPVWLTGNAELVCEGTIEL